MDRFPSHKLKSKLLFQSSFSSQHLIISKILSSTTPWVKLSLNFISDLCAWGRAVRDILHLSSLWPELYSKFTSHCSYHTRCCRSSITHKIMSICSKGYDAVQRNDSLQSVPLDGKLQIQSELHCSSREMRNLFFTLDVSNLPLGALLVNNLPSCDEGCSRSAV